MRLWILNTYGRNIFIADMYRFIIRKSNCFYSITHLLSWKHMYMYGMYSRFKIDPTWKRCISLKYVHKYQEKECSRHKKCSHNPTEWYLFMIVRIFAYTYIFLQFDPWYNSLKFLAQCLCPPRYIEAVMGA